MPGSRNSTRFSATQFLVFEIRVASPLMVSKQRRELTSASFEYFEDSLGLAISMDRLPFKQTPNQSIHEMNFAIWEK